MESFTSKIMESLEEIGSKHKGGMNLFWCNFWGLIKMIFINFFFFDLPLLPETDIWFWQQNTQICKIKNGCISCYWTIFISSEKYKVFKSSSQKGLSWKLFDAAHYVTLILSFPLRRVKMWALCSVTFPYLLKTRENPKVFRE